MYQTSRALYHIERDAVAKKSFIPLGTFVRTFEPGKVGTAVEKHLDPSTRVPHVNGHWAVQRFRHVRLFHQSGEKRVSVRL